MFFWLRITAPVVSCTNNVFSIKLENSQLLKCATGFWGEQSNSIKSCNFSPTSVSWWMLYILKLGGEIFCQNCSKEFLSSALLSFLKVWCADYSGLLAVKLQTAPNWIFLSSPFFSKLVENLQGPQVHSFPYSKFLVCPFRAIVDTWWCKMAASTGEDLLPL